jgi:hypothetical protein
MLRIFQLKQALPIRMISSVRQINYIVDPKGLSPNLFFDDEKGSPFDPKTTIHDVYVMEIQRQSKGIPSKKQIPKVNFNQMNESK